VTFVDSDDWVPDSWLMELYTEAEAKQDDIVWCDLTKVYDDHSELFSQAPTGDKIEDILADLMSGKIWGSCCNKLVRKSCIEKNGVSFHPEMNMWEDLHFFWHLMKHDLRCSYIPKSLYYYDCFSSNNSIVRYRKAAHIRSAKIFVDSVSEQDYLSFCSRGSAAYERIKRAIYLRKCMIMRWAFHLDDKQIPVKSLFPEVNEQFISESQQEPFWSENRCIALALKGYSFVGRAIYKAFDFFFRIKTRISGDRG
jgi:GT2 family glycosyltransferase